MSKKGETRQLSFLLGISPKPKPEVHTKREERTSAPVVSLDRTRNERSREVLIRQLEKSGLLSARRQSRD
jgi:hypothetical protein